MARYVQPQIRRHAPGGRPCPPLECRSPRPAQSVRSISVGRWRPNPAARPGHHGADHDPLNEPWLAQAQTNERWSEPGPANRANNDHTATTRQSKSTTTNRALENPRSTSPVSPVPASPGSLVIWECGGLVSISISTSASERRTPCSTTTQPPPPAPVRVRSVSGSWDHLSLPKVPCFLPSCFRQPGTVPVGRFLLSGLNETKARERGTKGIWVLALGLGLALAKAPAAPPPSCPVLVPLPGGQAPGFKSSGCVGFLFWPSEDGGQENREGGREGTGLARASDLFRLSTLGGGMGFAGVPALGLGGKNTVGCLRCGPRQMRKGACLPVTPLPKRE